MKDKINKAVLADLVREYPLPPVLDLGKSNKVKSGVRAGIMWTVKFRNG